MNCKDGVLLPFLVSEEAYGGLAHASIKLPALQKVLVLAKVSCGQLLKLWELGRQRGGCASQR